MYSFPVVAFKDGGWRKKWLNEMLEDADKLLLAVFVPDFLSRVYKVLEARTRVLTRIFTCYFDKNKNRVRFLKKLKATSEI
jgi:hypothetical protein